MPLEQALQTVQQGRVWVAGEFDLQVCGLSVPIQSIGARWWPRSPPICSAEFDRERAEQPKAVLPVNDGARLACTWATVTPYFTHLP